MLAPVTAGAPTEMALPTPVAAMAIETGDGGSYALAEAAAARSRATGAW